MVEKLLFEIIFFLNNDNEGIYVNDFGDSAGVMDLNIYNNTFYNNKRGAIHITDFLVSSYDVRRISIKNNIFTNSGYLELFYPQYLSDIRSHRYSDHGGNYNSDAIEDYQQGSHVSTYLKTSYSSNPFGLVELHSNLFHQFNGFNNSFIVQNSSTLNQQPIFILEHYLPFKFYKQYYRRSIICKLPK